MTFFMWYYEQLKLIVVSKWDHDMDEYRRLITKHTDLVQGAGKVLAYHEDIFENWWGRSRV